MDRGRFWLVTGLSRLSIALSLPTVVSAAEIFISLKSGPSWPEDCGCLLGRKGEIRLHSQETAKPH